MQVAKNPIKVVFKKKKKKYISKRFTSGLQEVHKHLASGLLASEQMQILCKLVCYKVTKYDHKHEFTFSSSTSDFASTHAIFASALESFKQRVNSGLTSCPDAKPLFLEAHLNQNSTTIK